MAAGLLAVATKEEITRLDEAMYLRVFELPKTKARKRASKRLQRRELMNNARQMIVNLPVLTDNDVVDMIRVLTVITDAFIANHRAQLQQQLRSEQPDLFDVDDEESAPF